MGQPLMTVHVQAGDGAASYDGTVPSAGKLKKLASCRMGTRE